MFWGFYEMGGGVINLFGVIYRVNRTFGGFTFPTASLNNAINPFLYRIIESGLFRLWAYG
ncbi:MAG: hypothetical protein IPH02_16705 [Sphingobacteriales bacterium]|nr:hypothetical protein [Sphingobacteriales bacterium]